MPKRERNRQIFCNVLVDLERSIYSGRFLLGVAAVMLALILSSGRALFPPGENLAAGLNAGYHFTRIMKALEGEAISLTMPLAAVLPLAAACLDERKNGCRKDFPPRKDYNAHTWSKVFVNAFSGGFCVLLGYVAAMVLLFLIYSPLEKPMMLEMTSYMEQLFHQGSLLFLMGMLWAGLVYSARTYVRKILAF